MLTAMRRAAQTGDFRRDGSGRTTPTTGSMTVGGRRADAAQLRQSPRTAARVHPHLPAVRARHGWQTAGDAEHAAILDALGRRRQRAR